jgi:hypothetical protein
MQKFLREFTLAFTRAACEGPLLYFAPLFGAFRQVRREIGRVSIRRGRAPSCKGVGGEATPKNF